MNGDFFGRTTSKLNRDTAESKVPSHSNEKKTTWIGFTTKVMNKGFLKLAKEEYILNRGGSRIFSRGGADFQKKFENFDDLFLGRPNWFFELSQSTVLPLFWLNFLRRRHIFEKTVKKAVCVFLARAPPQS